MAKQGRLPGDYAIDALVLEVDRRKEKSGDPYYSYGKLVADTTREEREAIAEQCRCGTHRRRRGARRKPLSWRRRRKRRRRSCSKLKKKRPGSDPRSEAWR